MLDGEFIEHVCDHSDRSAWNCMTLIAGKNATTTGQVLVAHNEDDNVYCKVYRGDVPQMNWQAGSVIPAENGRALIPQIEHTWVSMGRSESRNVRLVQCRYLFQRCGHSYCK